MAGEGSYDQLIAVPAVRVDSGYYGPAEVDQTVAQTLLTAPEAAVDQTLAQTLLVTHEAAVDQTLAQALLTAPEAAVDQLMVQVFVMYFVPPVVGGEVIQATQLQGDVLQATQLQGSSLQGG